MFCPDYIIVTDGSVVEKDGQYSSACAGTVVMVKTNTQVWYMEHLGGHDIAYAELNAIKIAFEWLQEHGKLPTMNVLIVTDRKDVVRFLSRRHKKNRNSSRSIVQLRSWIDKNVLRNKRYNIKAIHIKSHTKSDFDMNAYFKRCHVNMNKMSADSLKRLNKRVDKMARREAIRNLPGNDFTILRWR